MNANSPILHGYQTVWRALFYLLTLCFCLYITASSITERSIPSWADPSQNMRSAYHLAKHGVYSSVRTPETKLPRANNWREPVPNFVLAAYIKLMEPFVGEFSIDELYEGRYAQLIKYSNLIWALVLFSSAFFAVLFLSKSLIAASLTTIFLCYYALSWFDSGTTEDTAAALMVLSSILLSVSVSSGRTYYYAAAGIGFGLLTLTKSAFLYVALAVTILLAGAWVWQIISGHEGRRNFGRGAIVLLSAFALVLSPWLIRNYIHFGKVEITPRSGMILMHRAKYNEITWDEFRGAIWYWARPAQLRDYLGKQLGYTGNDVERGGRLQRLSRDPERSFAAADQQNMKAGRPENVVSRWGAARAEYRRAILKAKAGGASRDQAMRTAQTELRTMALKTIQAEPLKHVAMSALFLWRASPYTVLVLLIFFGVGIALRNVAMLAYASPALLTTLAYAAATHSIPRYSFSADIVAITCLGILLALLARWIAVRLGWASRSAADDPEAASL